MRAIDLYPSSSAPAHWPAHLSPVLWLRKAFAVNRGLTLVGSLMTVALLAALGGLVIDPQVITGAPAWMKPAKFAISLAIYCFTLVYLLSFVRGHRRLVAVAANATALGAAGEMLIIAGQVMRGTTSHFNFSTPLDALLYEIMGGLIVLVWTMGLFIALLLLRQRQLDPVWAWALRLGILLALVGMAVAVLMTLPTPAQLAAAKAGQKVIAMGAHSVGVPDGGPGLPLLGWSTRGGDLRIPHFFGIHALQVLLALGWLLTTRRARSWLTTSQRLALVWTAGLGYLSVIGIFTWQALRGQSIVAPDAATLAAFGLSISAVVGATVVILLRGRHSATLDHATRTMSRQSVVTLSITRENS